MDRGQRTGLVLAGGQGRRMGRVDKALVRHAGRPLLAHVLERLSPQVGRLQVVTAHGQVLPGFPDAVQWLADAPPIHRGPLAGVLAGLQACRTPWLLTVPCDAPALPLDLAERLAEAISGPHRAAVACTRGPGGDTCMEPVFSLLHADLAPSLAAALAGGERAPQRWLRSVDVVPVVFDDATGFFNANTPQDLQP